MLIQTPPFSLVQPRSRPPASLPIRLLLLPCPAPETCLCAFSPKDFPILPLSSSPGLSWRSHGPGASAGPHYLITSSCSWNYRWSMAVPVVRFSLGPPGLSTGSWSDSGGSAGRGVETDLPSLGMTPPRKPSPVVSAHHAHHADLPRAGSAGLPTQQGIQNLSKRRLSSLREGAWNPVWLLPRALCEAYNVLKTSQAPRTPEEDGHRISSLCSWF